MDKNGTDLNGLNPIPEKDRPLTLAPYVLSFWSTAIIIQVMAIGTFLLKGGLNLYQVLAVGVISGVLVATFCTINSFAGIKNGIPFIVQLRSSFGYKGAKVAYILRIVPAICWYGIGTWLGALAINQVMMTLFSLPEMKFPYFFILTIIHIFLSYRGIKDITWFNAAVATVICVILVYFFGIILFEGQLDFSKYTHTPGSWGILFFGGISAATANWATVMLNNSDLGRQLRPATGKAGFIGNFIGIIPPWISMVLIGMLIFIANGNDDPIAGLMALAPNKTFGLILMVFIILAQITSNLTTSVLPAALAFQDLFKVKWSTGAIISASLSAVTMPWVLFTSEWFFTFQNIYSSFLGPVLGILIADYWILRKGKLNLDYLYNQETRAYRYFKGFSPAAFLAMLIGAIISFNNLDVAWLVGFPSTFVIYLILKKAGVEKKFEIHDPLLTDDTKNDSVNFSAN
ncbi:cytosine permease [Neobacillus sp. SAB-20_R2A]|uniref:cytosine permease n=1 Tax=Neobacillus sp. SAB-20_R2A TaxID=3120519 RepID=UPI003C6E6589